MEKQEKIIGLTVEELNFHKQELRKIKAKSEALARLDNNPDFVLLFIEGYMKDEAVRLVHLLGDSRFNMDAKKAEYREDFNERMQSIARLSEYLRTVHQLGFQAEKELESLNEAENEFYRKG